MVEINIIKNIRGKIFDECNRANKPPYSLSGLELVQTFHSFMTTEEKHPCPNPHSPCSQGSDRKLIGFLLPGVGAPNSRQKVNLF